MTFNNLSLDQGFYWRLITALSIACAILMISTDISFAATTPTYDSNDVVGNTLCKLTSNLTGATAKAIATLAIFTVGCGLFMGKMDWKTGAMVACGVGIVFGAPQIVVWVSGSANSGCGSYSA